MQFFHKITSQIFMKHWTHTSTWILVFYLYRKNVPIQYSFPSEKDFLLMFPTNTIFIKNSVRLEIQLQKHRYFWRHINAVQTIIWSKLLVMLGMFCCYFSVWVYIILSDYKYTDNDAIWYLEYRSTNKRIEFQLK